MAEAVTFRMVNDQSGEEKSATLADEFDLRMQGFRVLDVGRYDAARGQQADAYRQPVPPDPQAEAAAERSYNDALVVASRTFPEATESTGVDVPDDDDNPPPPVSEDEKRKSLMKGTKEQLEQFAEQHDVNIEGATTKEQIVDRILAHGAAKE